MSFLAIWWALWTWGYPLLERARVAPVTAVAPPTNLTSPVRPFPQRLETAIQNSLWAPVLLDDVLGEGPGAWDPGPRGFVTDRQPVNCMIWFQKVVAEAYANSEVNSEVVLDRLRYFHGAVSFGTRKHYTEHWLRLDPGPLRASAFCGQGKIERVRLDPSIFTKAKNYGCSLFKMNERDFEIEYWTPKQLEKCFGKHRGQYFAVFAVPTNAYAEKYLKDSGPMGLVHAMIMRSGDKEQNTTIIHASTSAGQVLVEPASSFFEKMKSLHKGYAIYSFDEAWDFTQVQPFAELSAITECESSLMRN